jgi:hypothetical protein
MKSKVGTAHLSARLKKDLGAFPCRYCGHMVTKSPPRRKWIGGCRFNIRPGPRGGCRKFELAQCFSANKGWVR